jgi:hypothetical protein
MVSAAQTTSPDVVPLGHFAHGMANSILYHLREGEPVSILTLHHDGYTAGELIRFHFDAMEMALEWAHKFSNPTIKRAMLASEIPLTPDQYATQRGSTRTVA